MSSENGRADGHASGKHLSDGHAPAPRTVLLVPLPGFSLLSFAAAIDPMRAANRALERTAYAWTLASADGEPVEASTGIEVRVGTGLREAPAAWLTLAFAGLQMRPEGTDTAISELRRRSRSGGSIGGVSAAPCILAEAGLLDGYRATVHWEYRSAFARISPRVSCTEAPFEIDRDRYTCGGGTATMDMMLALIEADHGSAVARVVANQFQHERIRSPADRQRPAAEPDLTGKPDVVAHVIRTMARNIEDPVPTGMLADEVGLSVRQVERLFQRYVGQTPTEYYIALRLSHARELLRQTNVTVLEVAMATGFASQSHFAQSYRAAHGLNPSDERRG